MWRNLRYKTLLNTFYTPLLTTIHSWVIHTDKVYQYSNATPSYTFHWNPDEVRLNPVEAQAKCQSKGGQLVPYYATSEDEKNEAFDMAQSSFPN